MMYPLVRELAVDGIPVTVTCRVLKLARQPYYRWLQAPVGQRELTRALAERDEAMAAALSAGGETIMAEQIVREAFLVVPDAAAALQKADAISDPRLKELAVASVLTNSRSLKPDQALPVLPLITDAKALQTTVAHVFGKWSADRPADAANWLKANTPDYAPAAMDTVFLSWANEDAGAAAGWLRDLSPGPSRDAAVNRLARQVAGGDPESALTWASEVADQSVRTDCLRHILSRQKSGADAKALIERASLPPAVREELKTLLPP